MLHRQTLYKDRHQQTTPYTAEHDLEDETILGLSDCGRTYRGQTTLHPAKIWHFLNALPLNTSLFNWHKIAVAISAGPLHTLTQASSSSALTFVNALRFKHQLTSFGYPGGIFTHKIGWLAHHPWMSGGNQSQGCWLTQGSVPWSSRNNNRQWEEIQSESGLMILIQPATSDKAPVLFTASSAPFCNSLLSTD